jgi:hypothetical protein
MGDIVDNADGEMVFGRGRWSSSKIDLTIAGVNSLEDRP